jgi:hypothetical protein
MRFIAAPALGFIGGIAFGSIGSFPFLNSMAPNDSATTQTVARPSYHENVSSVPQDGQVSEGEDDSENALSGEAALQRKVELLQKGQAFLGTIADYTATIQKREVVKNELLDEQTILIKCRHQPFSVYLKWETADPGREVLFVTGRNNGKMIAHDGGWKSRLPAFSLAPDSRLAMRDARYPITTAGLLGFVEIMLALHREDLQKGNFTSCRLETDCEFAGRPCDKFTLEFASPSVSPVYRKSVTLIDDEWHLPVQSRHYEWPQAGAPAVDDESTLIESYTFTEVDFGAGLTDHDFDRSNQEYRFR